MSDDTVASRLLQQSGGDFRRTGMVKSDPEIQALLTKLVAPPTQTATGQQYTDGHNRRKIVGPDVTLMERLSERTATNIIDAQNLLQTLPDIETAMQVTVSAILAPKDLIESTLTWRLEPGWIPSELTQPMLDVIRDYFNNSYKISEKLPDILKDVLYLRGSRPILLLPESSIDHLINSNSRLSQESFASLFEGRGKGLRSIGILGNKTGAAGQGDALTLESIGFGQDTIPAYTPSVESLSIPVNVREQPSDKPGEEEKRHNVKLAFDPMVSVVDNPQILMMPKALERMRSERVHQRIYPTGIGNEAFASNNAAFYATQPIKTTRGQTQVDNAAKGEGGGLYRTRQFAAAQTVGLTKPSLLNRESVGHPTEFHLPSECVIPVHLPANPEKHLGYFVLLDRMGNPLVKTTESDYYNEMSYNLKTNRTLTDQMISNVGRHNNPDAEWYSRQMDAEEMTRIYSELMEVELTQRLRNGIYGGDVQVARPTEIYQIMFSRALAGMHTQLLYVPAELMTYIAFDYNQYGIGVSLLQKSKILGGLRAIMLFADIMAGVKNSVGNTVVDIVLDEEDPDPMTTMETIMHEFAYGRSSGMLPLGTVRPRDITNYMKQASVQYSVSGNSRLPTVKVSVEDKPNQRTRPDSALTDLLKKNHLLSLGVVPEAVDASQGPDFATSVVANNIMMAKRVMMWQKMFLPFLQDHVARYTLNSSILLQRLRKIIEDNAEVLKGVERPAESESAADLDQRGIDSHLQEGDSEGERADTIILDFLSGLRMELPKPNQASRRLKKEEFDNEINMIDEALKYIVDEEFLRQLELGDQTGNLPTIKAGIKAFFVRDWMRREGVMQHLNIITELDGDAASLNLSEALVGHVDALRKSLGDYAIRVSRDTKAWDNTVSDAQRKAGVEVQAKSDDGGGFGGGDFSESGGTFSGDLAGDDMGGDDLGGEGGDDLALPGEGGEGGEGDEEDPNKPQDDVAADPLP